MTTVRIVSYNVRGLRDDIDAAARVVRSFDPDVLLLQEVPRFLRAKARVLDFAQRCTMSWGGDHAGSGGTTVFTGRRASVEHLWHRSLPARRFDPPRGYGVVTVTVEGSSPVTAASIHLPLDADSRLRHIGEIVTRLAPFRRVVVGGDLNETAARASWRFLDQRLPQVSAAQATFPSAAPRKAIDAIFGSRDLVSVQGPKPILDPRDLRIATDHLPIWADLVV